MRFSPWWLCALVLVVGCGPQAATPTAIPGPSAPSSYGRFEGDVIAVWDQDGRNMTLRDDFAYIDAQGRRWLAPANSVINGASIPQGFWTFIGGPFEGRYRNASVVHDVECHEMQRPWEEVHQMFYEACLCGGVDETQAKMMYYAVYHFGPRWQTVTETQMQTRSTQDGQLVEQPTAVQTVMRMDPVPPTADEVAQVAEFVTEDKPNAALIQQTTRDALHRRPRHGRSSRSRSEWAERYRSQNAMNPPINAAGGDPSYDGSRRRVTEGMGSSSAPDVSAEERQWATNIVAAHLEQQAGAPVPADLKIRRTQSGYRIYVQYLQFDEQGQPFYYPGGHCSIWLSPQGQVRQVACGHGHHDHY